MYRYFFYRLPLFFGVTIGYAMDSDNLGMVWKMLATEVQNHIIGLCVQKESYSIENSEPFNNGEKHGFWLMPETMQYINLIPSDKCFADKVQSNDSDKTSHYFLAYQAWTDTQYILRIRDHENNKEGCFVVPVVKDPTMYYFDGANTQGSCLFSSTSIKSNESVVWFSFRCTDVPVLLLKTDFYLSSLMLYPDKNRIVYSLCNAFDVQKKSEKVVRKRASSSCVYVADVGENKNLRKVAQQQLDLCLRKTVYAGNDSFIGLSRKGELVHLWLDTTQKIQFSLIKRVQYDDMHKTRVAADRIVADVAVDYSYKTPSGFYPRIAYITKKSGGWTKEGEYELFVMDLCLFPKPTPMLHSTVSWPPFIMRLFYDKGIIGVLRFPSMAGVLERIAWKYDDFITSPDNLGPLYLKTVLAQKIRATQE